MDRYTRVQSVTFGQTELSLPLSVKLSRRAQAISAGGDNDAFVTSVEIGRATISLEVRVRGTAVAENLSLGQQADLSFTVAATHSQQTPRTISILGAVLVAVELAYEQAAMATALLRFVAEAPDGGQDPFSAEDAQ